MESCGAELRQSLKNPYYTHSRSQLHIKTTPNTHSQLAYASERNSLNKSSVSLWVLDYLNMIVALFLNANVKLSRAAD